MPKLRIYFRLMRPEYAVKHIFFFFGAFFAIAITSYFSTSFNHFLLLLLSSLLASSSNYVLNEWCDRIPDSSHPLKKLRPIPSGLVSKIETVYLYLFLSLLSLFIAFITGNHLELFLLIAILFNGILYNKTPFRFKDIYLLDVLSESLNNPLRFCLGWLAASSSIPPASLLISVWLLGYFLMTCKRIAEIEEWDDIDNSISSYRKSLSLYTQHNLYLIAFSSATGSIAFLSIFISLYRIEMSILLPILIICMSRYLKVSLSGSASTTHNPTLLLKDNLLSASMIITLVLTPILLSVDIPIIKSLSASGIIVVN